MLLLFFLFKWDPSYFEHLLITLKQQPFVYMSLVKKVVMVNGRIHFARLSHPSISPWLKTTTSDFENADKPLYCGTDLMWDGGEKGRRKGMMTLALECFQKRCKHTCLSQANHACLFVYEWSALFWFCKHNRTISSQKRCTFSMSWLQKTWAKVIILLMYLLWSVINYVAKYLSLVVCMYI